MKQIYFFLFCIFLSFSTVTFAQTTTNTYLVEAEEFQFPDKWMVADEPGTSGTGILKLGQTNPPTANAYTAITVNAAATYDVWTRARDYPDDRPGTRKFLMYVNEVAMSQESGKHGQPGYYWEKVGSITLPIGETLLRLKDSRGYYGRCDAVMLTSVTTFNPNTQSLTALAAFKTTPKQLAVTSPSALAAKPYLVVPGNAPVVEEMNNGKLKLRFVTVTDSATSTQKIVTATSIFKNGQWTAINANLEDNRISLLHVATSDMSYIGLYPSWDNAAGTSTFQSLGETFSFFDQGNAKNPFSSGDLLLSRATNVTKVSATEITATYATDNGYLITASWKLAAGADHLSLTLNFQSAATGYYSFVVSAFQPMAVSAMESVQLPPMFQYQRLPEQPLLVPSGLTPQPVSIVETTLDASPLSLFVAGAPSNFPVDWASGSTSPMGFSLKNESNLVQPISFGPILGFDDSKLDSAQTMHREFIIGAMYKNWDGALEYLSNNVYQVTDYRKQAGTSLTTAAFNIIDLIKNDNSAGWNTDMKGFYDIEENPAVAPTVVEALPLILLSAAVLGQDQDLYLNRALPALEYTLSRRGLRWSNAVGTTYTPTADDLKLNPSSAEFNVAYFEGVDKLTKGANPWLVDVALPAGVLRGANSWTEKLAAYKLTHKASWLNQAITAANSFVTNDVYGTKTEPIPAVRFYNKTFYPEWWDLMDFYELTKDNNYLVAAQKAAFYTIAGLRSYPKVSTNLQTIHPGNVFDGVTTIWWKGSGPYRLGFPRTAGDVQEHQITEDVVSPVGLGLEQPVTFFVPQSKLSHIMMSSWSPNLLRVYQYSNREIFQTYARNSIIGRFANYPGYYARGYTDLTQKADYPYTGPDVSSIYYHHIPGHLAFTLDFLITEAMQRSKGNIDFPYSKQEGFYWFNSRIFGGGKGKIYNDKNASLVMKKDLVQLDNPAVNYITAVSDDKFWVIMLNEQTTPAAVNVTLTDSVNVTSNVSYETNTNEVCQPTTATMTGRVVQTTLASRTVTALSFPLTTPTVTTAPVKLTNGMQVVNVDSTWGKLYVFRIRSPFGWDSIYTYLETAPLANAQAVLTSNVTPATITKNAYPYEFSLYHIAQNQQVTLNLALTLNGVTQNVPIVVNGTPN